LRAKSKPLTETTAGSHRRRQTIITACFAIGNVVNTLSTLFLFGTIHQTSPSSTALRWTDILCTFLFTTSTCKYFFTIIFMMLSVSNFKSALLILILSLPFESTAFVQQLINQGRLTNYDFKDTLQPSPFLPAITCLRVVAEMPMEKEEEKKKEEDEDDWIPSAGGFIPNIKSIILKRSATPSTITEVIDIQAYKDVVVEEPEQLVCVRFYAPWCRACRAVEHSFRRLPRDYPGVKFVEVPLTKENAYLHKGLGVPSLPFSHIYHPDVGLVEERKINKNVFGEFKNVLKTYVEGNCPVSYDETGAVF
jgi:thiol-disulfide isomerase/thioredoxin